MTPRKQEPHKHSVFNRLSDDRKDSILEYAESHTLKEILSWLKDDGLSVKRSALSRWLLLERHQRRAEDRQAQIDAIIKTAQDRGEIKTADELRQAGQILMEKVALSAEDPKLWFLTESLALKREKQVIQRGALALMERRVKLLEEREAKTRQIVTSTKLTPEEKEARVKQALGIT